MRKLRRHKRKQANELARLLVALEACSSDRRFVRRSRSARISFGAFR